MIPYEYLSYVLFGLIVFIAVVYLLDVLYDWWHLPRPRIPRLRRKGSSPPAARPADLHPRPRRRKGGTGRSPP
jgi:hypothetical protein